MPNEFNSSGRTVLYAFAFASLASSDHDNVCIVPYRVLSTFNTVALLGLSTTPKTRSRSLASGAQFASRPTGIPTAILRRFSLANYAPEDSFSTTLIQRTTNGTTSFSASSSSTTTSTSRPAPTLLLLYIPLNSANSVPESVNPALTSSTSPPPFKNVSPRAQRAYGFFSSPTPPPPCTE
ncbi:hypothetical protein DFP72DRAFT_1083647 [Ephemerocybe angulata]|uniref:Uncharacterized protein n=1 Tax=Ephemerocybe angulata TaxID=980116 RepID=A0A8H6LUQ3_9AGAR|nr:hypothetical protein DFP72DRAFT_1083647 [Tulosesus angulatus]